MAFFARIQIGEWFFMALGRYWFLRGLEYVLDLQFGNDPIDAQWSATPSLVLPAAQRNIESGAFLLHLHVVSTTVVAKVALKSSLLLIAL